MSTAIEQYLEKLDRWTEGVEPQNHLITDESVRPPLWTFSYRDLFGDDTITGFTYGLSSVDYPDWQHGRPELCISTDSPRPEWVLVIGELAVRWRGQAAFSFGEVLHLDSPISPDESSMSAVLLFAPTDIEKEFLRIELPDRIINLVQAYPMYESEIDLLRKIGPASFLSSEQVDFHNPTRAPLQ